MTKRFSGAKILAVSLALAGMVAAPLTASAHGWGGYRGGYHGGGYHGYYGGGYHRGGGHWSGGRWIAGAILTGVAVGVVADALRPDPYYGQRVVYSQPTTVVYDSAPVVTRRVVETRTVYEDPGYTRYVRDDGY